MTTWVLFSPKGTHEIIADSVARATPYLTKDEYDLIVGACFGVYDAGEYEPELKQALRAVRERMVEK